MKNLFNNLKVFCALMLISTGVFAQQSLVTRLNITDANLNSTQRATLQSLNEGGTFVQEETQYLSMGNFAQASSTGSVKLFLSGNPCGSEFVFVGKSSEYQNESNFSWYGEMNGGETECSSGDFLIVKVEGVVAGHFSTGNSHYELQDLSGGVVALMKVDPSKLSNASECGVAESTPVGGGEAVGESSVVGACTAKALVIYTAKAKLVNSNMTTLANLAISQFNSTSTNSQIGTKLSLATTPFQVTFTETSDIYADLATLKNNTTIKNLRNQYSADIVILITDGTYGNIAGLAYLGPVNASAYGIVEAANATSTNTFAHEAGHIFGGNHNTSTASGYAKGHVFQTSGGEKRTLLSVLSNSGTRIMYWSNPLVKYQNIYTGVSNQRDNAKVINQNGCTVAAFK